MICEFVHPDLPPPFLSFQLIPRWTALELLEMPFICVRPAAVIAALIGMLGSCTSRGDERCSRTTRVDKRIRMDGASCSTCSDGGMRNNDGECSAARAGGSSAFTVGPRDSRTTRNAELAASEVGLLSRLSLIQGDPGEFRARNVHTFCVAYSVHC